MISQTPSARGRRAAHVTGDHAQERRDLLPAIAGLGAGGHAKCTVEAIRSVLRYRVVALLDSDPALHDLTVLGCPVVGGDAMAALRRQGVELAFVGIGGAGDASRATPWSTPAPSWATTRWWASAPTSPRARGWAARRTSARAPTSGAGP